MKNQMILTQYNSHAISTLILFLFLKNQFTLDRPNTIFETLNVRARNTKFRKNTTNMSLTR